MALVAVAALAATWSTRAEPGPGDVSRIEKSDALIRAGVELWRFVGSYFDPNSHGHSPGPAVFAPDGRSFVVVAARGRVEEGTTESHLLLFSDARTSDFAALATLSSRGNEPAIADVRWPRASRIFFRGAVGDERPQVYSLEMPPPNPPPATGGGDDGALTRETDEPAGVDWYDVSGDGRSILYMARTSADRAAREQQRLRGVVARAEESGWIFDTDDPFSSVRRIMLARRGESTPRELWRSSDSGAPPAYFDLPRYASVSPNGNVAIVGDTIMPRDRKATQMRHTTGGRVLLLDLAQGSFVDVAEAPPQRASRLVLWSPDESFVVFNANMASPTAEHQPALVELNVASKSLRIVGWGQWRPLRWISERTLLALQEAADGQVQRATFERRANEWRQKKLPAVSSATKSARSAVSLSEHSVVESVESPTQPPEIMIRVLSEPSFRATHLNSAAAGLRLAPLQEISWKSTRGDLWRGRIVTEAPGEKRPTVVLVMDQSWNDGYILDDAFMRAAFPVQALAARGFTVCMVYFPPVLGRNLAREPEWEILATGFESLVQTLRDHPAVDSTRLGISGFSHAGWIAQFVIRRFPDAFAAAMAIDNTNFSYFDYLINNESIVWETYDQLYGSPLFGSGSSSWFERAVGFHPERVRAPVLIEAHGGDSADPSGTRLGAWEVYASLRRAGKAVEMVRYTYGTHTLVRPMEQVSSATRQVDWFAYWLMNEFDPRPDKVDQYARWRRLREP